MGDGFTLLLKRIYELSDEIFELKKEIQYYRHILAYLKGYFGEDNFKEAIEKAIELFDEKQIPKGGGKKCLTIV